MGINSHGMILARGVTKSDVCALCKNLVKEFEGTGKSDKCSCPRLCRDTLAGIY